MKEEEEVFYIECRIYIRASSYDVCFNRIEKVKQNSNLCDGYSNDFTKDDDGGSFEVIMTAYYDSEKDAIKQLKLISKKYKWFSIGEILDKKGDNILCELYD